MLDDLIGESVDVEINNANKNRDTFGLLKLMILVEDHLSIIPIGKTLRIVPILVGRSLLERR